MENLNKMKESDINSSISIKFDSIDYEDLNKSNDLDVPINF